MARDGRRYRLPWLLAPAGLVYLALLVAPLALVLRTSFLPPGPGASLEGPFSLGSYRALVDPYHLSILGRTLRVSIATTLLCLLLGYPLALSITHASGAWRTVQTIFVISPLFVSVVVRSYGWVLLLGNRGLVNILLMALGVVREPLRLLGTEGAVILALVEALLPFMTLSLVAVLTRRPRDLETAARGLGASPFQAFVHVTLPLSLPGALAGSLLVFMVSMGAYATPALVGGSRMRVMVTEIYTQVTTVFNWPLAAALSLLLLAVSLLFASGAYRLAGRTP
jgi:putative spermidine/putrescine transport system permease protein